MDMKQTIKTILEMAPEQRKIIQRIITEIDRKSESTTPSIKKTKEFSKYKTKRKIKTHRYPFETLLKAQELREKGYNPKYIARILDMNRGSVYNVKNLIKQRKNPPLLMKKRKQIKWTPEKVREYLQEKANGKTNSQLANEGWPRTIFTTTFKNRVKKQIESIPGLEKYKVY